MWHCKRPVRTGIFTLVYLSGVALFFLKGATLPCKAAYPAAWLAAVLFAAGQKPCRPTAWALLLSAAGDAAGAQHLFLLQIAFFAAAHVAYIRYFLPAAQYSGRRILGATVIGGGLLLFGLLRLLPRVGNDGDAREEYFGKQVGLHPRVAVDACQQEQQAYEEDGLGVELMNRKSCLHIY